MSWERMSRCVFVWNLLLAFEGAIPWLDGVRNHKVRATKTFHTYCHSF